MMPSEAARELEKITRDLDLVVFALERPAPAQPQDQLTERKRLLRELESLRDRIEDVARELG